MMLRVEEERKITEKGKVETILFTHSLMQIEHNLVAICWE
jgi:hypothetical protein